MEQIFFDGWQPLMRTGIIGVLAYISVVVLLRVSGRRTLSKMNAFDFVVTIALGSTLATVLLSKDVSLAQGVLALALLIAMQFVVTWLSVRISWVRRTVTGEPALLYFQGEFLHSAMKRSRVTQEEISAAVRSDGLSSLSGVQAVVIETDGSFSVIKSGERDQESALRDVLTETGRRLGERERSGR